MKHYALIIEIIIPVESQGSFVKCNKLDKL